MSIADVEIGLPPSPLEPFPGQMEYKYGVPMTRQRRIRFECFLVVGHRVVPFDFRCRSQADFELQREGPKTTEAFMDRVEGVLRNPAVLAELDDEDDLEPMIGSIREQIFLLARKEPCDFVLRRGNVSFSGRTDVSSWQRFP